MPGAPIAVPILAVVGPTAAGKTSLSLDLAERLGGEVVNTDAMQLYRGMDIGTAKVPVAERRGIPHHLLDLLTVREPATVAQFQGWARRVIADLRAAGRPPVLVGGSALYVRAVLDRFEFPGTDPDIRAKWEAELAVRGAAELHALLAERDPDAVQVGVRIDRHLLEQRIRRRVAEMFDGGLVDEVRRLLDDGLAEGRTASRAIGYQQVIAHLAGDLTLEDARERTVIATRQFARRQLAWWKDDPRITWIEHDAPDRVEQAVAVVAAVE